MSFFSKLRSRLSKSSSKIERGLDDLVAEGGEEPEAETETPPPAAEPAPESRETPPAERAPEPAPSREAEPDRGEEPSSEPPEEAPAPTAREEPRPEPSPERPRPADQSGAEPERRRDAPPEPKPEPAREARAEPEPPAPRPAPPAAPEAPPAPVEAAPDAAGPAETRRRGFLSRLIGGGAETAPAEPAREAPRAPEAPAPRRTLDDAMLEELEDLLIQADLGVAAASRVAANLAEGRFGRRLSATELKRLLAAEVAQVLEPVARPLPLKPKKPQVVLVCGVNGSGKTTTIGKLASQLRAAGKSVIIAAGDTFRAAAVEQLQVWGERAGVPVLTAPEGTDPASLAYDALEKAQAEGADLLMIDTAGRLQNRADLMAELEKIVRVLRKLDPDAPHDTLLVLDATVGQNALSQVELFRKAAHVTGLVMTKLDGTAKGGVLVALADRFGLPIHAIGVGEQIDDLAPFDPEDFARALTGADA